MKRHLHTKAPLPAVAEGPAAVLSSRESITGRDVTRLQAASKPLRTLCGRPMSEGFRAYPPTRHPLQAIVTDSSRRVETLRDVGLIYDVPLFGRVSPHTGEAIGL